MNEIEQKIRNKAYHSPSRARAAVTRSSLPKKEQGRLGALIDAWENEGPLEHVVAGLPEPLAAELVDTSTGPANGSRPVRLLPEAGFHINLNAAVRVKLTFQGMAWLYEARNDVAVPKDLLERQGVWETTLWELMAAFGSKLSVGESPVEDSIIEVLDRRAP